MAKWILWMRPPGFCLGWEFTLFFSWIMFGNECVNTERNVRMEMMRIEMIQIEIMQIKDMQFKMFFLLRIGVFHIKSSTKWKVKKNYGHGTFQQKYMFYTPNLAHRYFFHTLYLRNRPLFATGLEGTARNWVLWMDWGNPENLDKGVVATFFSQINIITKITK